MNNLLHSTVRTVKALANRMNKLTLIVVLLLVFGTAASSVGLAVARLDRNPAEECIPGSGYRWTYGPLQPHIADQAQNALSLKGIEANVEARAFGETDSCNVFTLFSIDFTVSIINLPISTESDNQQAADEIYSLLAGLANPRIGNVNIVLPNGDEILINDKMLSDQVAELTTTTNWQLITPTHSPPARYINGFAYDSDRKVTVLFGGDNTGYSRLNDTWEYDGTTWRQIETDFAPSDRNEMSLAFDSQRGKTVLFGGGYWTSYDTLIVFGDTWEYSEEILPAQNDKKVYVIVLDPLLSTGETLIEYKNWNDPDTLTQGTIDFFQQASGGKVNYTVGAVTVDHSGWPALVDGYVYTEAEYLAVLSGQSTPHYPDGVDYNAIVNDPTYDICGKVNRGEIDEVWIYNGPYFGFYESTLVGPGAYWYNSPPVPTPYECNRLVPIMGPNPERDLNCATENFGHRTESTMTRVYGSWNQNSTDHSWEKFALVDYLSPSYSYSGCGNIHYPPNGTSDYDYANPSTAYTNCDDFTNYPNLSDPASVLKPITCTAWDCSHLEYFRYWFSHFPSNSGCGPDNVANNWWLYFANPALANSPSSACQTVLTINYTTGSPGSYFTVTGSFFPADSTVIIEINGLPIASSISTSSLGDFTLILDTANADSGFYQVTVNVSTNATLAFVDDTSNTVSFELNPDYPLRPLTGDGTIISVPDGIGITRCFIPLVHK